jgi:8-demethyl-8-alpha-L-rhamnosyltetracenomycin-C 2'-O-methyltransferase
LEIGIKKRAKNVIGCESLHLWSHFFPMARIVGFDIIDVHDLQMQNPKFELYSVDCRKLVDLEGMLLSKSIKPDIVVDDGAHTPESHQVAFGAIFPKMASGSHYFIEDLQTCMNPDNFKRWDVTEENNTMKWLKDLEDGYSSSIYLSKELNEKCAVNLKSVQYFCNRKLALITKI